MKAARFLARLVAYCAIFVVALELSARLDDLVRFGAPFLGNYSLDGLMVVDDTGLHGKPFASFERWRLNSVGTQGREPSAEPAGSELVVLVLGASESFGLYESPGMSYAAQLERMLADRLGRPVNVQNAAWAGMSLPRATEYCQAGFQGIRPAVVVYYPTPAGYLDDMPPGSARPRLGPLEDPAPVWRFLRRWRAVLKRWLPESTQLWLRNRQIQAATAGKPDTWFFHDVPEDRVRLFEEQFRSFERCVRSAGVALVVGTHANRFSDPPAPSDRPFLLAWRMFYPRADERVLLAMDRRVNHAIARVAAEEDIPVADIAGAVPPDPRNFQDFSHFTDRGSTLAAAAFADAITLMLEHGKAR